MTMKKARSVSSEKKWKVLPFFFFGFFFFFLLVGGMDAKGKKKKQQVPELLFNTVTYQSATVLYLFIFLFFPFKTLTWPFLYVILMVFTVLET